ncbi:uncharacterized protein [Haliotis asinina]|uniref:uncharacterized protein isoform X2 n=1 Tax=Haliotis asinina TaxID=109174 RepID=UPI0035322181
MKLLLFETAIAVSSNTPCTNCDGNNVTCVDNVCLPRCVSVTSSGDCLRCRDSRFYGRQCQHDCPDTCTNSRCQVNNTRVVCTEGCVVGKKGDNCGVNCDAACTRCERYGDACTGPCHNPRFYGPLCRTKCPQQCTDGCDKETGECGSCNSDHIESEKMCLKCGPQYLYCDGHCFKCIGDNCHGTPCGNRYAYRTVQIIAGIVGVVVLIGSTCVVVNLARRKTKCRKRRVTQCTVNERSGANHGGLNYLAQTYWEIRDKDTDINSYVSILSLNEHTTTNVNGNDVRQEDMSIAQQQPSSVSLVMQTKTRSNTVKETVGSCFKREGLDMNPKENLTEDDEPDNAADGREVHHLLFWKSSSLSDLFESRKMLAHDRCNISLGCLSSNTQRLLRKTNSIVSIERNCDLSEVYVRYVTPGKLDNRAK